MESIWEAALLGLLQGLTEFLPVSSSGHLALAQLLVPGFSQPGVVFDAMLHVGTAAAVVWYERGEIRRWLTTPGGRRLLGLLVIGTIATAAIAGPLLIIIGPVEPSIGRLFIGRVFAIVVLGGMRGTSYNQAFQGIIIFGAMVILLVLAAGMVGGLLVAAAERLGTVPERLLPPVHVEPLEREVRSAVLAKPVPVVAPRRSTPTSR